MEFSIGSVIKAWDLGVATMKRGEVAVLYCKANYAYGENGSPPKIPPNATLVFEVRLDPCCKMLCQFCNYYLYLG